MRKLFGCAAMLLALHCGFVYAQEPPPPNPYPVDPDPQLVQKLLADDGAAGDVFGTSVSLDGNIAALGAVLDDDKGTDSGSAYVFFRGQDGTWTQEAKLVPNDVISDYHFGGSVSVSGNTVIVGAAWDDAKGEKSGSAYVFVREADGTWTQQAKLIPNDGQGWDTFGTFVSLDGDIALISAQGDDDIAYNAGSAYIFVRAADGTWSQKQKLTASDGAEGDVFGYQISLNKDVALIGAVMDDDKGVDSGSAYVFIRTADGTWSQQTKLTASDGAAGDYFGGSMSLRDDTALIGAWKNDGKDTDSGSAYIFVRAQDGTWSQQEKLTADDGAANDYFSSSLSLKDDTAIIAAAGKNNYFGAAYVFVQAQDGTWSQQAKFTADDGATGDYFGRSVSISDGNVLVGSYKDDDKGVDSGSAYIYRIEPSDEYTVTPSAGTGGSISPDSPQTVSEGATTSFTVLADSGYKIEKVEGCGGTLSGNTYTTAPVTEDCAVTASFMPYATRNGMTWGVHKYLADLDITKVHCFGTPKPDGLDGCNPYQGETSCSAALPVLCVKVDGRPRPPYPVSMKQWDTEYYNGWAEGSIGLTAPAQGNAFASLADADAYCAAQLGEGYKVAEHHTGRYVSGMDETHFYGDTWPANTSAGGWGFYAPGHLASDSRFWMDINDQNANCWGRSRSLTVSSSGASGVAITSSPSAYSGTTNYSKTGIASGTVITLTAPAAGSASTIFSSWSGCDSTNAAARTCTVTMSANKTVTANFLSNVWTVTPSAGTGGGISPSTPQSVEHGKTAEFTVTPNTGYAIDKVEGCGGTLNGDKYTTGAITADCAVTATFAIVRTVTPRAGRNGSISPSAPQTVPQGGAVTFAVAANDGYVINNVTGCGGKLDAGTGVYTTGPITRSCIVQAAFRKRIASDPLMSR